MKENINSVIVDKNILAKGYLVREGYVFTSLTYPFNVYDAIVIKNASLKNVDFLSDAVSERSIEEHVKFINLHQLEKAVIIMDSLDFIVDCLSLKYIGIIPMVRENGFSFEPLYYMTNLKSIGCSELCSRKKTLNKALDYSKIKGLIDLGISGENNINYNKVNTLRSLHISNIKKKKNLMDVFCSSVLDTLRIIQCSIESLDGIEQSENMTCLYLHYNRMLRDINALGRIKNTLKALRVENCPKIEDFSVLEELENLELLEITGNNKIPSLKFLKNLKNLKTFIFSVEVLDGDLTPCLDLTYAFCDKGKKYYNLKDKDLPKGNFIRGNESIEEWRRLE